MNWLFCVRIPLAILDLSTDLLQSLTLYSMYDNQVIWSLLLFVFPLLALSLSFLSYAFQIKCHSMAFKKAAIHTLRIYFKYFQAFYQSGPSLVVQSILCIKGTYSTIFNHTTLESWSSRETLSALLLITSCTLSLSSFLHATVVYNNEIKSQSLRRFTYILTCFTSTVFRVFILSVLFILSPEISALILVGSYVAYLIIYKGILRHDWESLIYSYLNLIAPSGHSKQHVVTSSFKSGSVSEVTRARLNTESFAKRTKIVLCLFNIHSLLLFIPYFIFVEIFNGDLFLSRLIWYSIPSGLYLTTVLTGLSYYKSVIRIRDAARQWEAITPAGDAKPSAPSFSEISEVEPLSPARAPTTASKTEVISLPTYDMKTPGNVRCNLEDRCVTCEFLCEGTTFRSMMTGREYRFMTSVNCETNFVVYLVTCNKCRKQYVGKTEQRLKQRHYGHRREIETQNSPLGQHFHKCGYVNWRIQIIDHCETSEDLKRREGYWIKELMTIIPMGLNIRQEAAE